MDISGKNMEKIKFELKDLIGAYYKYKNASEEQAKKDSKQLYLLRAGKTVESLIDYIITKEKILVGPKDKSKKIDPSFEPTLDDCIYALKINRIIKEDSIIRDLYNIKNWRNPNVHRDKTTDTDNVNFVRDSTIESVYDSYKEVLNWFFEVYLNNEYVDFSKNLYANPSKPKDPTKEELEEIRKRYEKNPFNIPDFSILRQSKKIKKSKKSKPLWIIIIVIILFTSYSIFSIWKKHSRAKQLERANATIGAYYSKLSQNIESDPNEFFADTLDFFYLKPGPITQKNALAIRFNFKQEYPRENETNKILGMTFNHETADISYYHVNLIYKGKSLLSSDSLKPYIRSLARMEIGFNKDYKITRLKYLEKPGKPDRSAKPF
jgi:hypothetical protein